MKLTIYIVKIFVICSFCPAFAQQPVPHIYPLDSLSKPQMPADSIPELKFAADDSLGVSAIPVDTIPNNAPVFIPPDLPISEQTFDEVISYGATGKNSTKRIEAKNHKIHLRGDAYVKYPGYEIRAGYIIFDLLNNEAYAEAIIDSSGNVVGEPTFITDGQEIKYKRLKYNFKTKKGIVYDAVSSQGDFFIHGGLTKFVSSESDSLQVDDLIYNKDALITTCNHPNPHYGIRTSKLKLIPNKLAIIGPSNLEIAGVPTPIVIPFAMFPLFTGFGGGRSGIVFGGQQGIDISDELGLGFRNVGYYFALSDYMDLNITGDIYTRGSWALRVGSNYAKRYKYRGNVQFAYSRIKRDQLGEIDPLTDSSFSFTLSHNQDPKFHPYINLGGNIRFTINNFDRTNYNDANSQLENIINSNFRFSHSLPSIEPLTLNINFAHSQNTRTNRINFTLPEVQLRLKTIYPFKRKRGSNKEKWYEKINVQGNSKMKNFLEAVDTLLFEPGTLDSLQTGFSHTAKVGASFNVLNYFSINPSVDYEELWYFKTQEKTFDPTNTIVRIDTTIIDEELNVQEVDTIFQYGTVNTERLRGFSAYRNASARFDITTNLFGTKEFKRGWLRGIRHIAKPRIGFNYRPGTDRYYEVVQTDNRNPDELDMYNPFLSGVFGRPSLVEKQMAITYGLQNVFEGKYYSKRDSTTKKFKIFNSINFNGSYNFAADTLRWSTVSMSGTANLFKSLSTLNINATFDPYAEIDNKRVNQTVWQQKRRPLRFERFSATLSTRFTFADVRRLFTGEEKGNVSTSQGRGQNPANQGGRGQRSNRDRSGIMDDNFFEFFDRFSISHTISYMVRQNDGVNDHEVSVHSLRIRGDIPLTDKWDVSISNFSYDFKNSRFVYPDLGISRDLHCWNMRFQWQPARGVFSFFIGVNTSELANFLKYDYGVNQFDGIGRRF